MILNLNHLVAGLLMLKCVIPCVIPQHSWLLLGWWRVCIPFELLSFDLLNVLGRICVACFFWMVL